MKRVICIILMLSIQISLLAGCASKASPDGLLAVPQADNVAGKATDMVFESAYVDFAVSLLHQSAEQKQGENLLISPLSILVALSMTANGADSQTLQEMEEVLGRGMSVEDLNEYLCAYLYDYTMGITRDEDCQLMLANSIWLPNDSNRLKVNEDFLQSVSNYYDAEIYKTTFDNGTLEQINNWANEKTDGMIPEVLDKIDENAVMYLINAISFDGAWAAPYDEASIREGSFTALSGETQTVSMMHSEEHLYLADNRATGFIKPYSGGNYQFAVLVPNEGVELQDYLESLTANGISQTLAEAKECPVVAQMPSFSCEFDITMNEILKDMGMHTAFDPETADLSKLATDKDCNLYISNVLHKTFIRVDGLGTQAGATTTVEIATKGSHTEDSNVKEVIADRPFVYMILDGESNLPLFIGCVTDIA